MVNDYTGFERKEMNNTRRRRERERRKKHMYAKQIKAPIYDVTRTKFMIILSKLEWKMGLLNNKRPEVRCVCRKYNIPRAQWR